MKKLNAIQVIAALLIASVCTGSNAEEESTASNSDIEDYALVALLENLTVLHYLKEGKADELRELADINIQNHLSNLREQSGANTDPDWLRAKVRAINAIGLIWKETPPQYPKALSHDPKLQSDWLEIVALNSKLIEWAFAQCREHPEYECKKL